jgi:predicted ATP-grasp superfamily ATP-dependent carboligase
MPAACVMGDTDLIRPLALLGIPCFAVADSPLVRHSRYTRGIVSSLDAAQEPERLVEELVAFARAQPSKPVLFYEGDADLLLISRRRERLAEAFRFTIPEARLVEDLSDKRRFAELAGTLDLPVPPTRVLRGARGRPADLGLAYPCIVKPPVRRHRDDPWDDIGGRAKAVVVSAQHELEQLWPRLAGSGLDFVVQQLVPGPETRVESYHAYIDDGESTVAEFTGRKLRTLPPERGHSSAIVITDRDDVAGAGRSVLRRLGFRGVAKVDFKRDADGRLWLLEVNARFSLWHNPGAVAGVNIPALVYADCAGVTRPPVAGARPGIRWCDVHTDRRAAAMEGVSTLRWLRWAMACESRHAVARDDPMPFLRGIVLPYAAHRARRATRQLSRRGG